MKKKRKREREREREREGERERERERVAINKRSFRVFFSTHVVNFETSLTAYKWASFELLPFLSAYRSAVRE